MKIYMYEGVDLITGQSGYIYKYVTIGADLINIT